MRHRSVRKIGNWNAFSRLALNLNKELELAKRQCLKRWSLKAEGIAKTHLSTQDLAGTYWAPLAPYTIQKKMRKGQSLNTLIASSTYFQAITSWVRHERVGVAYAGVKRTATYRSGNSIKQVSNVARIQEFGTTHIPARPLWQPTYRETMKWHLKFNRPGDIFLNNIRIKYS